MPVGGGFNSCGCGGGDGCASPTTPIATTGLCLPDGTPLAVVAERDCVGTVAQTGWLNLVTGAYTTGVPPAGAAACGDSRSITVSGVFCDTDPDGTVHGLVLVEYHYADDGSIDSVRLVDAASGETYVLVGELTICPGGGDTARQIIERCGCDDTDGDGIGDVQYTELWSIDTTGTTPALLVGTFVDGDFDQPYTPVAPVDCPAGTDDESPGEPEQRYEVELIPLCVIDVEGSGGVLQTILAEVVYDTATGLRTGVRYVDRATGAPVALPGGATIAVCAPAPNDGTCVPVPMGQVCYAPAVTPVTVDVGTQNDGTWTQARMDGTTPATDPTTLIYSALPGDVYPIAPAGPVTGLPRYGLGTGLDGAGAPGWGYLKGSFNTSEPITAITLSARADDQPHRIWLDGQLLTDFSATPGAPSVDDPATYFVQWSPIVTVPVNLPAGPHELIVENSNKIVTQEWGALDARLTLTQAGGTARAQVLRQCDGTTVLIDLLTGQTVPNTAAIVACPGDVPECPFTVEVLRLCDMNPDVTPDEDGKRCATPFLRALIFDCTGGVVATRDTTMDGVTPYTAVNPVDCAGGMPALVEVPWNVITAELDPANPTKALVYTLARDDDPTIQGTVHVTVTSNINSTCPNTPPNFAVSNTARYTFEPDQVLRDSATYLRIDLKDFDTFEPVSGLSPRPNRLGGTATWSGNSVVPTVSNGTGEMYYDGVPETIVYTVGNTGGGTSCSLVSFAAVSLKPEGCCGCTGGGSTGGGDGVTVQQLCVIATANPDVVQHWTRIIDTTGVIYYLDPAGTRYDNTLPAGYTITTCDEAPPCRHTSSTLLCDTSATDLVTVFDPANVAGSDGWEVISFVSAKPDAQPEGPLPYPAIYGTPYGYPALGARTDQSAGYGGGSWTTYDAAPLRWVIRKEFTAPEDGVAIAQSSGFRGDGGARVRINGQDAGLYGQWNRPATSGTAEVPVTAGVNVVEIEVRDVGGINNVVGRLDIALPKTVQFMRRQTVDCGTGEVIATHDTTLDGDPYEVTGEVGQCEAVSECCEQPPPETRVDVESDVMCIVTPDGAVTGQVVVERVYDDQTGERTLQRLADPTTGNAVELPDGAVLTVCPTGEPCGDTELATLCDLVYSPQAPIPTPASDFTLTGNVVVGNEGTTLWFAQANQEANGVAELTVSGLLPAVMFEVRFASAWIGAGAPDPANNNAIYLLEVLDGTTVLATRARNTSNGSNVFPGGVLSEDLPPLAFIAPATGAVTIRFTDQSTGGAINDRDLFLMPFEVRTTVLTVTSTPFLRRFTFGCDGGLTSTQDLGLDGVTPYTVAGEVATCSGEGNDGAAVAAGPDTEVLTLCDVAGDGTSVPFLRLLTIAADGTVTVADTGLDGVTAYTVGGTVGVCDPGADGDEPCRNSTTLLVCDVPASTTTEVDADLADSTAAAAGAPAGWGNRDLPGPYTALWSGGTLNVPATAGPAADTTAVTGVLTAAVPAGCEDASGTLTVSVRITNQGPDRGQAWDGTLQLKNGATIVKDAPFPSSALAGQTFVRTVSAPVTLAELASGDLRILLGFETYHLGAKSWTASEFSAVVELEGCDATTATQILRTVVTDCVTGEVVSTSDTTLDGEPYTVTGDVGLCVPAEAPAECCPTGETLMLCDIADDGTTTAFLRHLTYSQDSVIPTVFDTALDGTTPYAAAGTVGLCGPDSEPCTIHVVERCRCDDADSDGVGEVGYVELVGVDTCTGDLTVIGTYTEDWSAPYTPVAPVECEAEGADPSTGIQAHRVDVGPGESWSAAVPLLQSVTATAHEAPAQITTVDGTSTLHEGESVTWSVVRDGDAALTGPLTITAGTGPVTVAFTAAVTL